MEVIGWSSTAAFLISIVVPNRVRLHQLGVFAAVTTGLYAYYHGATAIWVKWFIAFFFHSYMIWKYKKNPSAISAPIKGI
jgi:hypothetical protein